MNEWNGLKLDAARVVKEYKQEADACQAALQGSIPEVLYKISEFGSITAAVRKFGKDGIKIAKGTHVYNVLNDHNMAVHDENFLDISRGRHARGTRHWFSIDGDNIFEKNSNALTDEGLRLRDEEGIDFTKIRYGRTAKGKIDFIEIGKSAKESFKSGMDITSDFKGFSDASALAKTWKILGAAGTILTVASNAEADFVDDTKSSDAEKTKNFAVDTTVDIASAAGSGALGAAIGTAVAGPAGTLIGYAAGIGINFIINQKAPFIPDGQSATGWAKSGLKGMFHF